MAKNKKNKKKSGVVDGFLHRAPHQQVGRVDRIVRVKGDMTGKPYFKKLEQGVVENGRFKAGASLVREGVFSKTTVEE
jgi:hypothetical protein